MGILNISIFLLIILILKFITRLDIAKYPFSHLRETKYRNIFNLSLLVFGLLQIIFVLQINKTFNYSLLLLVIGGITTILCSLPFKKYLHNIFGLLSIFFITIGSTWVAFEYKNILSLIAGLLILAGILFNLILRKKFNGYWELYFFICVFFWNMGFSIS